MDFSTTGMKKKKIKLKLSITGNGTKNNQIGYKIEQRNQKYSQQPPEIAATSAKALATVEIKTRNWEEKRLPTMSQTEQAEQRSRTTPITQNTEDEEMQIGEP